jgi:hypothetical protein
MDMSVSASKALESARAAVAHADGHIANFETMCRQYIESDPCKLIVEYGFGPPQYIQKLKVVKPVPLAVDILNSLRSALDQAGYAVSVASGASGSQASFPFGDTPAEAANRRTGGAAGTSRRKSSTSCWRFSHTREGIAPCGP